MGDKPPQDRFWENILSFCDLMKDILAKANDDKATTIAPEITEVVKAYLLTRGREEILRGFIDKSEKFWDNIRVRSEEFFRDQYLEVFANLPQEQVKAFHGLLTLKDAQGNPVVGPDRREEIWAYFVAFVKISIHYMHSKCGPKVVVKEGKTIRAYSQAYTIGEDKKRVPIMGWAAKFGVELAWP